MNESICESPIEVWVLDELSERYPDIKITPQAQIGRYRVDFLLPDSKVIIECDGEAYHTDRGADWKRDQALRKMGYRVVRFSGKRIYKELISKNTEGNTGGYDVIDVINFLHRER